MGAMGHDDSTPAGDPAGDVTGVTTRFRRFLEDEFGGPVELAAPVTTSGRGFDSDIYFVRVLGEALPAIWRGPLVLRVKARPDALAEARFEADVQDWAAARGYPTPRVLRVFEAGELADGPAQVIERAPGDLVLDRAMHRPWAIRHLIGQLARLQARLHRLDTSHFPEGVDLLDNRLRLTQLTADALDHPGLREALARIESITPELRTAPHSACHGDFHPLNVLVADESMSVIDWTDAGLGDRHADLARSLLLYDVAHIAASSGIERQVLRRLGPVLGGIHRRAYERVLPIDGRRIHLWTAVHALHGWSQVVGAHEGIFHEGHTRPATSDRLPQTIVDELAHRFDAAMREVT